MPGVRVWVGATKCGMKMAACAFTVSGTGETANFVAIMEYGKYILMYGGEERIRDFFDRSACPLVNISNLIGFLQFIDFQF